MNGLTSVTPGRPDNRTLGVQLPHSLSDPRTSPLRTPRRSGEYVQFDSRREQLPFEPTRDDQHPTILLNGTSRIVGTLQPEFAQRISNLVVAATRLRRSSGDSGSETTC